MDNNEILKPELDNNELLDTADIDSKEAEIEATEIASDDTNTESIAIEAKDIETDIPAAECEDTEIVMTDAEALPETPPSLPSRALRITRAIMIIICALIPIVVGVISTVIASDCEINNKYIDPSSVRTLIIAATTAILIPFICIFIIGRNHGSNAANNVRWAMVFPIAASLNLSYHTLTNDIGSWSNTILFLSIASVVFFLLKALKASDILKVPCAICLFALGTAIIAMLYLDFDIELNSPYKVALQFGAVGIILGTIADARATLDRIGAGWFVFLKSVASSLCLICVGLVLTAFAQGSTVFPQVYSSFALLYLGYAISAIAEMIPLVASQLKTNV